MSEKTFSPARNEEVVTKRRLMPTGARPPCGPLTIPRPGYSVVTRLRRSEERREIPRHGDR